MFYYFLPNSLIQEHEINTGWGDWVDEKVCCGSVVYKYQLINGEFKFVKRQIVSSYKYNLSLCLKPYEYINSEKNK